MEKSLSRQTKSCELFVFTYRSSESIGTISTILDNRRVLIHKGDFLSDKEFRRKCDDFIIKREIQKGI